MDKFALPHFGDMVPAFKPVDLQTAANNGLWLNMQDTDGCNVIFWSAIGTAADDPVINLRQAKTSSGGSAKTLQLKRVYYKIGSGALAAATDQWVKVTTIDPFAAPADSYSTAAIDGAENEIIICIHVEAMDLDVNNGFKYIQVQVADVGGNAQLGCAFYLPSGTKYKGLPHASALV